MHYMPVHIVVGLLIVTYKNFEHFTIILYFKIFNFTHTPTLHSSKEGSELLGCTAGAAVDIADFTGLPAPIGALRAEKSRTK